MARGATPHRMSIAVGLDLTGRSEPAFNRALRLALERNARLTLVHAIPADYPDEVLSAHSQYAKTLLQDRATRANSAGLIDVTQVIARGRDYEAIVEQARQARADLVVLGVHRSRGAIADLLGTTTDRVLRFSAKPVLLVQTQSTQRYKCILVAVDFSAASRRALDCTLDMFPEAEILVVNTWGWRRKPFDGSTSKLSEQAEAHRLALKSLVLEADERAAPRLDGERRRLSEIVEPGLPGTVIPDLAEERLADLVVVGTHARAGVTRFIIGSVAEEIMLRTGTDVLVVPSPSPVEMQNEGERQALLVA